MNKLAQLVTAPVKGLIFAIFLPFIGIFITIQYGFKALYNKLLRGYSKFIIFGWHPTQAYLTGKNRKKNK